MKYFKTNSKNEDIIFINEDNITAVNIFKNIDDNSKKIIFLVCSDNSKNEIETYYDKKEILNKDYELFHNFMNELIINNKVEQ